MSGETMGSTILSGFVNSIWDDALLTAREQSVMANLVTTFADASGLALRKNAYYRGGTVATLAESADLSSTVFDPAVLSTLTPQQFGVQYFITDLRIESDPFGVRQDAALDLGQLMATYVDTRLCETGGSLTGGTVGTAGGTITWANIFNAQTKLRAAFAPQPYIAVVRPEQWYFLANTLAAGQTVTNSPALQDNIANNWFVGNAYGINFYVDANITAGTAAKGFMFSRQALALDVRRAPRIEVQRDASRGGGGYELNATLVFAYGNWRPAFGIQMIGTSTIS